MKWFRAIKRKLWLILLLPLVASGTAYLVSAYLVEPVYEADITLFIYRSSTDNMVNSDMMITQQYLVRDYRELIKSRAVMLTVIDNLGLQGLDPEKLAEKISVSSRNDTNLIEITIEDSSPELAVSMANEVGRVFIQEVNRLTKLNNVSIVDSALLPEKPEKPNIAINVLAALLAGFLISLAMTFLLDYLNDYIETEQDVLQQVKLNVLGIIPKFPYRSVGCHEKT